MYSEIEANKRKTVLLMFGFFALVSLIAFGVGYYFQDWFITAFSLVFATGYALWTYFASDKLALSINKARQIEKKDNPRLWRIVENLSITEGLPMPRVYIVDDPAPNAFATGRNPKNAAVAATTGILDIMTDTELEGVFAHELGHVKNYDIRVSMIAFGLVAAVSIISDTILRWMFWGNALGGDDDSPAGNNPIVMVIGIVALILAPLIATIIQLSISRKREYLADATGALTTRYPEGLASALEKIRDSGSTMQKQSASTAHLFFANPLKSGSLSGLFSTHPPIDDRIKRLREMGSKV
ncbi:zinc metalloprotease HtpX [Candidatus Nomurabacteria bacterium]|jgi:heat shock protein HtpX|nr:zinc metalloprotease HtpX [Candidatus Saccharibacteria bacterium]MCA9350314.1 zinc metalloprotease HtpX [Candidatus Saccharibacteria bacterium]MCB9839262.1 zinc metalloprotease HtpX [Candidatus Nomurabacteria bacterium]